MAMLYYSIVMVSIGSLSTGSPSVSSFSSGECMGQCHTTVLLWFQYLSISKTLQLVHTNKTEYRLKVIIF